MAITKCLIDDHSRKEYLFPTLLNWVEKGDILPQKYLYSNPIGAFRYSELIQSGIHQKIYNNFPVNVTGSELNRFFGDNINQYIGDDIRRKNKLGVFILGAGLAQRELETVRWLIYNYPNLEKIRIWLLDISEEMMTKSIKAFRSLNDPRLDIYGFILDFEESLAEIATVRSEFGHDTPCLFLLYGNTIANLDQKVFLDTISHYMAPRDIFVMEYLLADEAFYKSSYDDTLMSTDKFGFIDPHYSPAEDNRYEFVVSPLRLLGLNIRKRSLKLYRRCQPGKGVTLMYVYELEQNDIDQLKEIGMSKSLYAGWKLPLLKIERLLSSYITTVSQASFNEPVLCKSDYGLSKDFTVIYSMMQKDEGERTPMPSHIISDSDQTIVKSLSFRSNNHTVMVNNKGMQCTPKQYYLLLATAHFPIEGSDSDNGPDKIYHKFSALFNQWSKTSSNIDYRTEMVLDNMTKLPENEYAVFISKGLRDIENKIRKGNHPTLQLLLPLLPHRNQWYLNLSNACIELLEDSKQ